MAMVTGAAGKGNRGDKLGDPHVCVSAGLVRPAGRQ